ncbi:gamma-glutamyltransferase [Sphingosinicella rhizophila]|uniref:Gamma-glutamyltransferase n=1 Tax=Sphingosinicella rhizophila TaxID=3050082 RepID=A0ABU3Q6L2_9SPHN|nr:gamma-glutamyltransferase [Sphingosinicella sp. GR2756]MDT9598729.1 gamma-glutamyltransferase [Sphingosinicella sp. GR2756]
MRPARPDPAYVSATAGKAMISTSHPLATEAGLTALRRGGTAVDAYLAAAAVQTVVEPTMTGLGGGLGIMVFDPATGKSRAVGGMALLPAAENVSTFDDDAFQSGRTATVPAWVSAAHGAWKKWGKLAWSDLWTDALSCARDGFIVDQLLWGTIWEYRNVPGITQAGRDVWYPGGRLVCVGEELRQPALARTIEGVAEQGPDYFYRGDFARHYVDVAQAAGGRLTLDDMASAPDKIIDMDLPELVLANGDALHTSGLLFALALNLASIGNLGKMGRPTEDADSLYLSMRIIEESWHHGLALAQSGTAGFGGFQQAIDAVSPEAAEKLWPQVKSGPPHPFDGMSMDTCGIVAIDESGLIAHGTHSTTSTPFGVGLIADGVLLARPVYHFARRPVPLPAGWGTSLLMLRGGKPLFTAASPSISAIQNVFQNSVNVLEWGMTPGESVQQPMFGATLYPSQRPIIEATMGETIIADVERRGLKVQRVSPWEQEMGSCHSLHIAEDGTLDGAADPRRLGRVAGY